jgi:hypothetical protein
MLERLSAERVRGVVNALLGTNGQQMNKETRAEFMRDLDDAISPRRRAQRAPRATPGFLRALQGAAKRSRRGR